MSKEDYHEKLHLAIGKADNFANAIYHDVVYDIDRLASERTGQRLNLIDAQFGPSAVFGVLGNWATRTIMLLDDAAGVTPDSRPVIQPYWPEGIDAKTLDITERAKISGLQFVTSVANDDLEMAEAIYMAARESSVDDVTALVSVILRLYIDIADRFQD